jgi:predicted aspartyl protease
MDRFRAVLVAILLTALWAAPGVALLQGDDMGVPLTRTGSGLLTVPVWIGGETYTFLLDTGSARTVVSEAVARSARVKTYPGVQMIGSTGAKQARQGWLDAIRVGQLTLTQHWVVVADLATVGRQSTAIDGILGNDVLSRGRMRLDLSEGKLWLMP